MGPAATWCRYTEMAQAPRNHSTRLGLLVLRRPQGMREECAWKTESGSHTEAMARGPTEVAESGDVGDCPMAAGEEGVSELSRAPRG